MFAEMARRIQAVLRDERGIESLEWIAMAFLIIVLFAVVVYPGTLDDTVNAVIGRIGTALT